MEFFDLKIQYRQLKEEIDAAVLKALEKGVFVGGGEVAEFESKAAGFLGVKYAITLNSGTDAIYLALRALGIGAGDEVITTPFTFFATAEMIVAAGAKPVFVDIDPETFNIDVSKIEAAITENTKAIMPVHIFGQAAAMDLLSAIAKKHNLFVIEDAAQAIGAKFGEKFCGAMGDIGCFSFFPTKNLGAYGDGGMVTTNRDEIASKIKIIKSHGSSPENKYKNLVIGVNSRLDTIQAAILNVKIKYLDQWNQARGANARYYDGQLGGVGDVVTPFVSQGNNHIYHQYTLRTARRDKMEQFLKQAGIPAMVYYSIPLHLQPALGYLGYKAGDFPVVERISKEVISLPVYPELPQADRDLVISKIKEFYAE